MHNKFVLAKNKCIIKQAKHKTIPFTYRNSLKQNQKTLACTTYSHVASDKKEPFNTKYSKTNGRSQPPHCQSEKPEET